MLLSNMSAFVVIEIVGRRPLLLYGMILLTLIELVSGEVSLDLGRSTIVTVTNSASLWASWDASQRRGLYGLFWSAFSYGKMGSALFL